MEGEGAPDPLAKWSLLLAGEVAGRSVLTHSHPVSGVLSAAPAPRSPLRLPQSAREGLGGLEGLNQQLALLRERPESGELRSWGRSILEYLLQQGGGQQRSEGLGSP